MIPVEEAEPYYSKRQRTALATAEATADPAVRNIHLEMIREYIDTQALARAAKVDASSSL